MPKLLTKIFILPTLLLGFYFATASPAFAQYTLTEARLIVPADNRCDGSENFVLNLKLERPNQGAAVNFIKIFYKLNDTQFETTELTPSEVQLNTAAFTDVALIGGYNDYDGAVNSFETQRIEISYRTGGGNQLQSLTNAMPEVAQLKGECNSGGASTPKACDQSLNKNAATRRCSNVGCPTGQACYPDATGKNLACRSCQDIANTVDECDPDQNSSGPGGCSNATCTADPSACCIQDGRGKFVCRQSFDGVSQTDYSQFGEYDVFIERVRNLLTYLGIAIAVILFVSCGYKFMTSQGDPYKLQDAKECLTSAVIGLLFIALSVSIMRVLINTLLTG